MTIEDRVLEIENRLNKFEKSDRYIFEKNIQMMDGRKIQVGNTNGLTIGTSATQKLGFFNVTPIVKPAAAGGTLANVIIALQGLGLLQ